MHRFLTRRDKPFPLIREALSIAIFLTILATILWGATGQPFLRESPVVVVESGSMMHCSNEFTQLGRNCDRADDVPYGRFGTIDPGDLIFVKDVETRADVQSWADAVDQCDDPYLDCGCDGRDGYGACGDVIIFQKSNPNDPTPVIHRALFYLEVHGDGRFSIDLPEGWGCSDLIQVTRADLRSPCLGRLEAGNLHNMHVLDNLRPEDSGFITRGDNNRESDQLAGAVIEPLPVPVDRILGKARGEVPWLGLVKLLANDIFGGCGSGGNPCDYSAASGDVKTLAWLSLAFIIVSPAAAERIHKWRKSRQD